MFKLFHIVYHTDIWRTPGDSQTGGLNVVVRESSKYLSRRGFDITVICSADERKVREFHYSGNFRTVYLPYTTFERELIYLVRRESPSLIHIHYWLSGIKSLRVIDDAISIFSLHSMAPPDSIRRKQMEELLLNLVDFIFVSSSTEYEHITKNYNVEQGRIFRIGYGLEFFRENQQITLSTPLKYFLYVGRIVPQKGVDLLIDTFLSLPRKDFFLIIVGESEGELMKYSQNILYVGKLSRDFLMGFYRNAYATVLPSMNESYGLVILESLACGTPVITTPTGEATNLVKNFYNGFLVNYGDREKLREALMFMIEHPHLVKAMKVNALNSARKFSWENSINSIKNAYEKILREATIMC